MKVLERFRRFWYVPTIDAMQADMLRGVKARNQCDLFFRAICRQTAVFAKEFGVQYPDLLGRKFEDCFGTKRNDSIFDNGEFK